MANTPQEQFISESPSTAETKVHCWEIASDIALINEHTDKLKNLLQKYEVTEDCISDIVLAFREGLANAIIHGNLAIQEKPTEERGWEEIAQDYIRDHPTDKQVHIRIEVSPHQIEVTIEDEGNGFDPNNVASPLLPQTILHTYGRGILLSRISVDSLTYEQGGRLLRFIKHRT